MAAAAAVLLVSCGSHVASPTAPTAGASVPAASSSSPLPAPSQGTVPRPPIVWKPIPYPVAREREMLAYAKEHYDVDTFDLIRPEVIVEHFTVSTTFAPVFETFAANTPDLGELPGTCAHFVVDTDGTIYQLVSLQRMCRHTVGLNYTAIGIEMVGESDQDVLRNPRQRNAMEELTLWLMATFHIELRNVIGHNESLTNPFHKELVPSFRCQTHGDWTAADMDIVRRDLAQRASTFRLPLGPAVTPVASDC